MKSVFLLCFLIAILEISHSSPIEPDEKMTSDGTNQDNCDETYKSDLAKAGDYSDRATKICISDADYKRSMVEEKAQRRRSYLDGQAQLIEDSLSECRARNDNIKYFSCMRDGVMGNQAALGRIERGSSKSYNDLKEGLEAIKSSEDRCISYVKERTREEIDEADKTLQKCRKNDV